MKMEKDEEKRVFLTSDNVIRNGGVLSGTDRALLKSLETGEGEVHVESPEQLEEISRKAGQTLDEFKKTCSKMTAKQARIIRMLRVEKHYSWRHLAETCYAFGWGKWVPPSNQLMGVALCWKAAQFFNENYEKPPWN